MSKLLIALTAILLLGGCAATGKALGTITMIPINASAKIIRAASY